MSTKSSKFILSFLVALFSLMISGTVFAFTGPTANPPTGGGALYSSGGNVGIGTTPSMPLQVATLANGNGMKVSSASNGYYWTGVDAVGTYFEHVGGNATNDKIRYQVSKSGDLANYVQFKLDPDNGTSFTTIGTGNGNVGIGTATPGVTLDVNGTARATAFLYSSDFRLKKNIKTLSGVEELNKISALNGVSFEWKKSGEKNIGFIAQDVEKIYPELVKTDKTTGLKSVAYGNLVASLVEAVKEEQRQINELKDEIKALKQSSQNAR